MALLASRPLGRARQLLAASSTAEVDQQISTLLAAPNPPDVEKGLTDD